VQRRTFIKASAATALIAPEWRVAAPSPPSHGNFTKPITVYRGAYDYSVSGAKKDFCAQNEAVVASA